ncbi:Protein PXR1 [Gracilaria domingensis]|nr:Protein PXR1 [Gracilaria domingensis]
MPGSIDARNQAWANDKSRFGLKMLQKMGWSEGKGLGRDENGRTNALRAKKNFGKEGLGVAVVKNSVWDAPAQVAQGLNSVLAKLSSSSSVFTNREGAEQENAANRAVGFYARRAAQKDVKAYSSDALREIFGGIAENGERDGKKGTKQDIKKDKKDVKDSLSKAEAEAERKRDRREKRKKKEYERLGVASKIRKPHKGDKKKRKRKKEKAR